jgi:hypothetical protein
MERIEFRPLLDGLRASLIDGPIDGGIDQADHQDGCLLEQLLAELRRRGISGSSHVQAHVQLRTAVGRLLAGGYTLRSRLPNVPAGVQAEWLGRRLVLGHARWFARDAVWTSIVSSRLGRYGRLLADWPALLELVLRAVRRTGSIYLAVPDTTLAPLVEPLLLRSAIPHVRMRLPAPAETDVAAWLADRLRLIAERPGGDDCELHLSPELSSVAFSSAAASCAPSAPEAWPLQDRIAIGCAQRVRALLVRPRGTTAQLLERRLSDSRWDAGCVSVWLPGAGENISTTRDAARRAAAAQLAWLQRGAVGWYVAPRGPRPAGLGCRTRPPCEQALWQLNSKYAFFSWGRAPPDGSRPRYLVHCVRGAPGWLPAAAAADLVARSWLAGQMPDESPLVTLANILASKRLRGRAALNRAAEPCVSFSAVPLEELVARRSFQSHLGRWDWEPFGLMIQREALERLGARPVIYGDAETYRRLSASERPFFQPARRRSARQQYDWEEELEWRVPGDVRLEELPRHAICLFVAYAHQAQSLARHSPWPVIWLREVQTHARPGDPARRSRRGVRTSRN